MKNKIIEVQAKLIAEYNYMLQETGLIQSSDWDFTRINELRQEIVNATKEADQRQEEWMHDYAISLHKCGASREQVEQVNIYPIGSAEWRGINKALSQIDCICSI